MDQANQNQSTQPPKQTTPPQALKRDWVTAWTICLLPLIAIPILRLFLDLFVYHTSIVSINGPSIDREYATEWYSIIINILIWLGFIDWAYFYGRKKRKIRNRISLSLHIVLNSLPTLYILSVLLQQVLWHLFVYRGTPWNPIFPL
jgi:hypothetical protein